VDETVVEQALDEVLSSDEEMDRARRALASRSRNLTDEKGKARAFRFLVSRGFSESVARRVVFDAAAQAAAGRAGAADVD
jgi:SOS response regulatory protein OraA/RecX